eukprot:gene16532-18210_t
MTSVNSEEIMEKKELRKPHKVGGRTIDVRRAIPKNDSETALVRTKRLFVGGVSSKATKHDIANYINETYNGLGHLVACDLKRGFAFLEVSSEDFADLILINDAGPFICGKQIKVKKGRNQAGRHCGCFISERWSYIDHTGNSSRGGQGGGGMHSTPRKQHGRYQPY